MKTHLLALAFATLIAPLALVGCSTGDDADGSTPLAVNGSVGSLSVAARAALAVYGDVASSTVTSADGGVTVTETNGLTIAIADKDDTCTELHTASTTVLSLAIFGQPTAGSSYPVVDSAQTSAAAGQVEVDISGSTATCADDGQSAAATGGTVTVSALSSSEVSGTFDVTFATGHLTGTFTAPICASALAEADASPPPAPLTRPHKKKKPRDRNLEASRSSNGYRVVSR